MEDYKNLKYQVGTKGGGDPYIPVEEPDSLQSKASAKIVDLLCAGEITGWANGSDSILKSTYLNEIPIVDENGVAQFDGISVVGRKGTTDQDYLPGYDAVETENSVQIEVSQEAYPDGYDLPAIADSDVDDVRVTIGTNGFLIQEDDGDIRQTSVNYRIQVKGDGGTFFTVVSSSITGKTTSQYQKGHLIKDLSRFGSAPWTIRIIRDTADSTSVKLQNKTFAFSYTTIKNVKLRYPDTVVVGLDIDAQRFGNQVPYRYYKIKGKKCRVPNNYLPSASGLYGNDLYSGTWDGVSFEEEYTTNPAWVLFDLLTDTTYGLGLDDSKIDVWSFYSAGVWCDGEIEYKEKVKNALGTYDSYDRSEKRFEFNGTITGRRQALEVINHLASVVFAFPIWQNGQLSLIQDRPKDVTRVASFANVKDGNFVYEGTPRGQRSTICRVQYSDPTNFNKPAVVSIQDDEGLKTYGANPVDIVAYGCINRNEAIRRARLLLSTDLNNNEIVSFVGGIEWASCEVGEIVEVQDPNMYILDEDAYYSGRITGGTTTSITLDRGIELDSGNTYTLHLQTGNDAAEITTLDIPSTGTYTTLTWSGALEYAPEADFVYTIYCSEQETARRFMISAITEVEFGREYQVQAILYNPNKWTNAESGIAVIPDTPPEYQGEIEAPTNLSSQVFTYTEGVGAQQVRKYGVLLDWIQSDDPRVLEYEVRYRFSDYNSWNAAGITGQISFSIDNLQSGTYDFAVRARAVAGNSPWVYLTDIVVNTALDTPPAPQNLQVKGGGSTFAGRDCHVEWDSPIDSTYTDSYIASAGIGNANLNYKVEVRKTDDTLLRTFYTASDQELEYTYTYGFNQDDNSGTPLRQFRIDVYTVDSYGSVSVSAATLVASNPAPSMASSQPTLTAKTGYLRCAWDAVVDNDMSYYEVYFGTSSINPNTLVEKTSHPNTIININDVSSDSTYYAKVVPYDAFGIGVQSQISDGNTPLQIVDIDVASELEESIKITDSVGSDIERLRSLYDFDYSSHGLTYRIGSTDIWIQYEYAIDHYIDRVAMYMGEAGMKCYFAYSLDGTNFDFLKANTDHTLAGDDADTLLYATSQADAKANYFLITAAGKTSAIFPNNIPAKQVRMYMTRGTADYFTNVHEFVPSRIVISELAALGQLSAITANIGEITAGSLRSENFGSTAGMGIDLNTKQVFFGGNTNPTLFYDDDTGGLTIRAAVTFESGSNGYSSITDAPSALSSLDASAAAKLDGMEDFATDDSGWRSASNISYIDGGKIYAGSEMLIAEGGKLEVGNGNVVIESEGTDTGRIVIASDGGFQTNDYCLIENGDIVFYYYDASTSTHVQHKNLNRIEVGSAANNSLITLPGYWRSKPEIIVTPKNIGVYDKDSSTQDQSLTCAAVNIEQFATDRWRFTARANLELSSGVSEDSIPSEDRTVSDVIGPVAYYAANPTPTQPLYSNQYILTSGTQTSINVDCLVAMWLRLPYSYEVNSGGRDSPTIEYSGTKYATGVCSVRAETYESGAWRANTVKTINGIAGSPLTAIEIPFGTINAVVSTIQRFRFRYYFSSWYTYSVTGLDSKTSYVNLTCRSISGFIPGRVELASGDLNYMAIGN